MATFHREYDDHKIIQKIRELREEINFGDRSHIRSVEALPPTLNSTNGLLISVVVPLSHAEMEAIYDASVMKGPEAR